MKTRRLIGAILCCLCASVKAETKAPDPTSAILSRYSAMLVEGKVKDAETVRGHMTALKKDGSWPDVNYKGKDRSDWEPFYHMFRTLDIAKAYAKKGHPLHGNKELLGKILLAMDHWLTNGYKCPNSWYNTNATPKWMGDIAALINDDLTGDRRKAAIEIVGIHQRLGRRRWSTGANLMDVAQTAIVNACLTGDTALLTEAARRVAGEMKVSTGEGIKDDWSFHQHGASAQLGYGTVYLWGVSQVGTLLRGTPYEIPKEKRAIVSQYILNGVQWMIRGPYQAPSVQDRQVSRPGCLGPSGGVRGQRKPGGFVGVAEKWMAVDPDNAAALKEFVARQNGKAAPLVGFKHFYRSDISAYHRPGFSLFIRTRSPRVKGTEGINRENLKGRPYLHTGDHYILMDTSEYTDMPPVWDWTRLPGLTMYEGIGRIQPQPFVGGVGNGTSGLTAIVCLLGGWQEADGKKDLRTTLDQCALKEPVQINVGGKTTSLKPGTHQLQDVRWVLHNEVGYVPLSPSAMSLQLGEVEGSWRSIDAAQSDATVKANVFLCDLLHGESPKAGGFILAPGSTAKTLDRLTKEPPCVVIRNDRDVQCIRFADGTFMAAFYAPGEVELDGKLILSVDEPCLALWSGEELRLCDPTNPQQGVPVKVMWRGKTHSTTLPAGGKVLHLPQAERPAN